MPPPASNEPATVSQLFARYRQRFLRFARHLSGGAKDCEADDCVQEASLNYLRHPREHRSESHFRRLFHRFVDHAARKRRARHEAAKRGGGAAVVDLPTDPGVGPSAEHTGPATAAERGERYAQVLARLDDLEADYRQVIELRLQHDFAWKDIADRMQLSSEDAARKKYAYAMGKLRQSLRPGPTAMLIAALAMSLTAVAGAQLPESAGPAVGLPAFVNLRPLAGGPSRSLLYKKPGLSTAGRLVAPVLVEAPLPGPGGPLVTPAALGWRTAASWRLRTGFVPPPPMLGHTMALDPGRGAVLLLGPPPNGGSWEWNGTAWRALAATLPPPRQDAAMVTQPGSGDVIVLFGGRATGVALADTWAWDGTSWHQLAAASAPGARWGQAMAHEQHSGRSILFGGRADAATILGDTWAWDSATATWVLVAALGPGPRANHAMAYDASRQRVVLFGGSDLANVFDDTWEWDGTTWTRVATAGPGPRTGHAMAWDPIRQRVVLTGGSLAAASCDTWEWDGSAWREVLATPGMSPRTRHAMAWDGARMVVFGGLLTNETWTRDGPALDLDVNDFSLGIDYVPARVESAESVVFVPSGSWIGMALTVRPGSVGLPGSTIRAESGGNGAMADIFSYVFAGSDPGCLPSAEIDRVRRAVDADEGSSLPAHDLCGIDLFLPAYNADPSLAIGALAADPSIYFTVAREGLGVVPASWWGGTTPSGASILVATWNQTTRAWSQPRVWLAHDAIAHGMLTLPASEEIDGLAIGRNYNAPPPADQRRYLVFSTRGTGSATSMPNQLMVADVTGVPGLPTVAAYVWKIGVGSEPVSRRIGLGDDDDADGICTWDPCWPQASPNPRRRLWQGLQGQVGDPPLLSGLVPTTRAHGCAYRYRDGAADVLHVLSVGGVRPGTGVVAVSPDPVGPFGPFLVVLPGLSAPPNPTPMGIDLATPTTVGATPLMFHWLVFDSGFTSASRISATIRL